MVTVHGGTAPGGAVVLQGRGADLVDMLSIRAPFTQAVSAEQRWLVGGLAEVFDTTLDAQLA